MSNKKCLTCGSDNIPSIQQSNICQHCKENIRNEIKICEEWETKRKKKLNDYLDETEEVRNEHFGDRSYYYSSCQKCANLNEKSNSFGDKKLLDHICSKNDKEQERERERERERESKSDNISPNTVSNLLN